LTVGNARKLHARSVCQLFEVHAEYGFFPAWPGSLKVLVQGRYDAGLLGARMVLLAAGQAMGRLIIEYRCTLRVFLC
jgi:hypothetical protein